MCASNSGGTGLWSAGRSLTTGEAPPRCYYVKDHLGSIRAVVDATGDIKETRDYYPYGLRMDRGKTTSTPAREDYTGHELDAATGLHYAGARYYMSALGRWAATDPILGEQGATKLLEQDRRLLTMSAYNYAFNSPTNLTDPTGMAPMDWFRDSDGEYKHDENVKSQADLNEGQEYLGESLLVKNEAEELFLYDRDGDKIPAYGSGSEMLTEMALGASGMSAGAAKVQGTLEAAEQIPRVKRVAKAVGAIFTLASVSMSGASSLGSDGTTTHQVVSLSTDAVAGVVSGNPFGALGAFILDASDGTDGFKRTITREILQLQVDQVIDESQ